jgi:hypothetical protein
VLWISLSSNSHDIFMIDLLIASLTRPFSNESTRATELLTLDVTFFLDHSSS